MKIRAYIFTYQRPEMLEKCVAHLKSFGIEPVIKHDGVDFPHRGKRGFWITWDEVLKDARTNKADIYLFMPDDHSYVDIDRIKELHNRFRRKPYAYNIVNDGRTEQWVRMKPRQIYKDTIQVSFTDCGFFCPRNTLDIIGYKMSPIPDKYFDNTNVQSSGVGMQLTQRLFRSKIPCYIPVSSLAYHGDHPSVMHPEERAKNKLISK